MANGQKRGFTVEQLGRLREALRLHRDYQGAALLNLAVDSMLRVSDLVRLRVRDLRKADGTWRDAFTFGMRKEDGRPVMCHVLPHTHDALGAYAAAYQLTGDDLLFPLSSKTVERQVKAWALSLGLEPSEFGCHSLRRTKAAILADDCSAAELDQIRVLLGHKWLTSTQSYLGTDQHKAAALARSRVV
jgi:integrase